MSIVRKTISVTTQQSDWIKSRLEEGGFADDSDYIRDLLRRDQEQNTRFTALKKAIQEGLESGISDKTLSQIWADGERRSHSDKP